MHVHFLMHSNVIFILSLNNKAQYEASAKSSCIKQNSDLNI